MQIVDRYRDARNKLSKIERTRNVKVLFACESGSRMWGFESPNSDYDVRFIYCRPLNSYLGSSALRDVIDSHDIGESKDNIDPSGWDIIKALDLVGRSNPQVMEWLRSPIKYYEYEPLKTELLDIAKEFNPRALMYHYSAMAKKQFNQYINNTGEKVTYKKYFYSLQPLLSAIYLDRNPMIAPPLQFEQLLTNLQYLPEIMAIKPSLTKLWTMKREATEEAKQSRFHDLDAFIEEWVPHIRERAERTFDGRSPDQMRLDDLCRRTIKHFWS